MSYSITFEGPKEETLARAERECRGYVALGVMTEDQAAAVIAFARNVPGTHLSGSISGHNEEFSGTVSVGLTGRVQSG